jgi:four helix bundle protein
VLGASCQVLRGTDIARARRVSGARRYEDLDCWRLANELKIGVYDLLEKSPAKKDFEFRDQIMSAASSGPSNLAEGFGHYRHKESARYARIAKASLTETHNHLADGVARRHWTAVDAAPLLTMATRAIGATAGWIRYLESTDTPPAHWEPKKKAR